MTTLLSHFTNGGGVNSDKDSTDEITDGCGDSGGEKSNSKSDNTGNSGKNKSVDFHSVQIREYERSIGDNPSVSSGPPVSISWKYNQEKETLVPVDDYEKVRLKERRTKAALVMPRFVREDILKEEGISRSEMAQAIRSANATKAQRRTTLNNMGQNVEKLELALETAKKVCVEVVKCKNEKREVDLLLQRSVQSTQ